MGYFCSNWAQEDTKNTKKTKKQNKKKKQMMVKNVTIIIKAQKAKKITQF